VTDHIGQLLLFDVIEDRSSCLVLAISAAVAERPRDEVAIAGLVHVRQEPV
jgi:hypothetical protein